MKTAPRCCPIVELRQYTLHAGQRDVLVELFEREFIGPQIASGAQVIGQFRDLDDPDRFVWLRGFATMDSRWRALTDFYGGPVWTAHRAAANATLVDSGNVLLLRPARDGEGFDLGDAARAREPGAFVVAIHYLEPARVVAFGEFFEQHLRRTLAAEGASVIATFVSETGENTFARLPVRSGETVFAWFARFADDAAERAFLERRSAASGWRAHVPESLLPAFMRKPELLRLRPTDRSALR